MFDLDASLLVDPIEDNEILSEKLTILGKDASLDFNDGDISDATTQASKSSQEKYAFF
jgi:hypothetical protein